MVRVTLYLIHTIYNIYIYIYKSRDRDIRGNIISIIEQFLTDWRQSVKIDGSFSEYMNAASGSIQGSFLSYL